MDALENLELNNQLEDELVTDSVQTYRKWISGLDRKILTADEELEYLKRIKQGDMNAKKYLVECNLKLVLKLYPKYLRMGLSAEDLIQAGNEGIIIAVDKFDLNKGCKFSTYAVYWIIQSMIKAIHDTGRTIRISANSANLIYKINNAKVVLSVKLGRTPTDEEIAKFLDIPLNKLLKLCECNVIVDSLDEFISIDGEEIGTLGEIVGDDDYNLEDIVCAKEMKETLIAHVKRANLNDEQIEVLKCRMGYYNDKIFSLKEIADMKHVSREMVRQLERNALDAIIMRGGNTNDLLGYLPLDSQLVLEKSEQIKQDILYRRSKKNEKGRRDYQKRKLKKVN